MIKQPDLNRQRPPIRGGLVVVVVLLGLRAIGGFGSLEEYIELLTNIDPAVNPVLFVYMLLYIASVVTLFGLTIATVAGLIQGDRRFRKYFVLTIAIRLVWVLVNLAITGEAGILGELLAIALWDGLMLLYFYKSKRVRAGYFPEAAAARKEKPSEERVIDQGW